MSERHDVQDLDVGHVGPRGQGFDQQDRLGASGTDENSRPAPHAGQGFAGAHRTLREPLGPGSQSSSSKLAWIRVPRRRRQVRGESVS
jgi:hypothetical protein